MLIAIAPTKNKTVRTVQFSEALAQAPLRGMVAFFVAVFAPLLCAQDVDIRVLNGRNGKPITNECLNISLGSWHGGDLIAPTNGGGIVVLHLENGQVTADGASPHACNGMAALGPKALPRGTDTIAVLPAEYMACQEYAKFTPNPAKPKLEALVPPLYSVKRIAESGISASNTCGKFRAEAKPGELIFYVRPRSFLEKWRQ